MSNRRRGPGRAGGPNRPRLTDEEQFAEFVRHVRAETAKKIKESSYVMSFLPTADGVDVKFAVELGLSIMLQKPLVLVVRSDADVPEKLRQIADAEIVIDEEDFDTDEGQQRIADRINAAEAMLGL